MESESNRVELVARNSKCFLQSPSPSEVEDHRMAMMEFEAAEALAGLAHFAVAETGSHCGPPPSQRVKDESPLPEISDQDVACQQQCESLYSEATNNVKMEQEADLFKPNVPCSTGYAPFQGSKPRQSLTEVEKEERRIRRVLANRESARQTIRRRQAFYEELTKKAACLTFENENLRKDMESAVKEYECLKSTNEWLKSQMEKKMEMEAEQTPIAPKSATTAGTTLPPTNSPVLVYNQLAVPPFFWPQSSTPMQLHIGSEQDNPLMINGGQLPLYFMPYPCFFPLTDQGHDRPSTTSGTERRITPSLDLNDEPPRGSSMENHSSASSSSHSIAGVDNGDSLLPRRVDCVDSFANIPLGVTQDGSCQIKRHQPEGMLYTPTQKADGDDVGLAHNSDQWLKTPTDVCSSRSGKRADNDLATEARKRRKEVTKLKKFYFRSSQIPC